MLLLGFLFCTIFQAALARDQCTFGSLVQLDVMRPWSNQEFFGALAYPTLGSDLPPEGLSSGLVLAQPLDACGRLTPIPEGAIVVVTRGACSFKEKALAVQDAGGGAMVLFDNKPGCVSMSVANEKNGTLSRNATIPCLSISHDDGLSLSATLKASRTVLQTTLTPAQPSFDPASVVLLSLAVVTLVTGALWSGNDHKMQKVLERNGGRERSAGDHTQHRPVGETLEISWRTATAFVALASVMLVSLFYFMDKAFYVLLGLFCIASTNALAIAFEALILLLLPPNATNHTLHIPCLGPSPTVYTACLPLAAALSGVWLVWRDSEYAWVLQDLQGVALMLLILRTLKLVSIKVACVLLPLCFIYDVFWVFLSPYFFGGESVMVEVAQGGPGNEALPMLLRIPNLGKDRQLGGWSLLGYGDVVLPGLLVSFLHRLDVDQHTPYLKGYFLPATMGFAAGLALCYAALYNSWFGDQGQPALLYLVPCTLGLVIILAAMKGELSILFEPQIYHAKGYRTVGSQEPCSNDHNASNQSQDLERGAEDNTGARCR